MKDSPGFWNFEVQGIDRARFAFEFDLWFVVLVYCGVWLLACVLWQRRKKRRTAA